MLFPPELIELLQQGKLAVIPTDTLYGIVCSANNPEAVEALYRVRGRDTGKPCIILIDDIVRLETFGIVVSSTEKEMLEHVWPGQISVVLDCLGTQWSYLHRGTQTLAFRVPDDETLRVLLQKTGPLLAPSANLSGKPPAHTLAEAKKDFGDCVAMYIDGGYRGGTPSTVARLKNAHWEVLREGAVKLAQH